MSFKVNACSLVLSISFSAPFAIQAKGRISKPEAAKAYDAIGSRGLALLNWEWQPILPEWKISFEPGRKGFLGMTDPNKKRIWLYIRKSDTPGHIACTLTHEYTHAFDVTFLTDKLRKVWLAIRGISFDVPWLNPCEECSDFAFGSGDFAECVKWTLQRPSHNFKSALGGIPTSKQQELILQWLHDLPQKAEE